MIFNIIKSKTSIKVLFINKLKLSIKFNKSNEVAGTTIVFRINVNEFIFYQFDIYYLLILFTIGPQQRKDIDLNLKPFRRNNNITNYIYKKKFQFETSNKYLLLLLY